MNTTREPLLSTGTIVAIATAVLFLLVSFGISLSDDQQSAILGVIGVLAPVVVAVLARPKVTPVADPRANSGAPLTPRV